MKAKELQQKLKEYEIETDKLKRLDKVVSGLASGHNSQSFQLQITEIKGGYPKNPYVGNVMNTDRGPVRLAAVQDKPLLGIQVNDFTVLQITMKLLEGQRVKVDELKKSIQEKGIEI